MSIFQELDYDSNIDKVIGVQFSVLSPVIFVTGYANVKFIGPIGLIQSSATPMEDLIPSPSIDEL